MTGTGICADFGSTYSRWYTKFYYTRITSDTVPLGQALQTTNPHWNSYKTDTLLYFIENSCITLRMRRKRRVYWAKKILITCIIYKINNSVEYGHAQWMHSAFTCDVCHIRPNGYSDKYGSSGRSA